MGKRHEYQFTPAEYQLAESVRVLAMREFKVSGHCYRALREDGYQIEDAARSLRLGRIVEMSDRNGQYRIVTRWEDSGTARCAVAQEDGTVVTYWVNDESDNHVTLDLGQYSVQAFA